MNAISLVPVETPSICPRCGRGYAPAVKAPDRLACVCSAHDEALEGLVWRSLASDPEGREHPFRVGRLAAMLAAALGISEEQQALLERAAALHDIGKMSLPEGVLGHRHVLDPEARRVMERHTLLGASILAYATSPWMRLAATIALAHHERWDGSGYPSGLAGEKIPLAARLVAVADVYDALRSERPYKDAQDHDEALGRMLEGDGRISPAQFDPCVLKALRDQAAAVAAMPR
ncbi:HD domain-containing protein [Roseomonas eburnea]|uniref:HD domain-containing protein n=1 Tax=Neoroseomonas eburnea TaxID=1346889 RepID=A0A9X9X5P1_9PROT|nr:HD domain-containing phosphohydrolase [Neoroseomonas eburnea]MBR0679027.1 HD domain-containing protein [Neoroseomonas eburnea]